VAFETQNGEFLYPLWSFHAANVADEGVGVGVEFDAPPDTI